MRNEPFVQEVKELMANGKSRLDAVQVIANKHGINPKGLRDATYRFGIPGDPKYRAGREASAPGVARARAGNIVKEAEQLLDLAERASREIDNLCDTLRTKDKEIASLQKRLEKGKEAEELAALQGRFRKVSEMLRKHLPAVAQAGD